MYEQMRNDFLVALSDVSEISIEAILKVLDNVAVDYDIKQKEAKTKRERLLYCSLLIM